jgi:hypothetical protein
MRSRRSRRSSGVRGGFAHGISGIGRSSGSRVSSIGSGFAHGSRSIGSGFRSGFDNRSFFLLGASRESEGNSDRAESKFDFHLIDTPKSGL